MKFEMLFLPGLLAACLLVCSLVLGSMLHAPAPATQLAASAPACVHHNACQRS